MYSGGYHMAYFTWPDFEKVKKQERIFWLLFTTIPLISLITTSVLSDEFLVNYTGYKKGPNLCRVQGIMAYFFIGFSLVLALLATLCQNVFFSESKILSSSGPDKTKPLKLILSTGVTCGLLLGISFTGYSAIAINQRASAMWSFTLAFILAIALKPKFISRVGN